MRAALAVVLTAALLAGCTVPNGGSAVFLVRSVLFTGKLVSNDTRPVDVVVDFVRTSIEGRALLDESLIHLAPHGTEAVNKTIPNNCLPGVYALTVSGVMPKSGRVVLLDAAAVRQGCGDY